jgi:hypothetical protein
MHITLLVANGMLCGRFEPIYKGMSHIKRVSISPQLLQKFDASDMKTFANLRTEITFF